MKRLIEDTSRRQRNALVHDASEQVIKRDTAYSFHRQVVKLWLPFFDIDGDLSGIQRITEIAVTCAAHDCLVSLKLDVRVEAFNHGAVAVT